MQVDDNFKINAFIEPDDANNKNIIFESSNENIAKVDGSGLISALLEGETTIYVASEENSNIKKECRVVVVI